MEIRLNYVNNILAITLAAIGFYIVITPFLPLLQFRAKAVISSPQYKKGVEALEKPVLTQDIPTDNRIRIPKLFLDEKILEGSDISVINKGGTWLRPKTTYPSLKGNSVIVGHRFSYNSPATFYNLDKLDSGDKIVVFWDKNRYVYEVFDTYITNPKDTTVEAPTSDPQLTLYTCAPLWSARDRLIVKAKLLP